MSIKNIKILNYKYIELYFAIDIVLLFFLQ